MKLRMLQKLYSVGLVVFVMLYTTGCPQSVVAPTPQAAATKTLLATRQAVIGTATTLSALCQQQVIKPEVCAQISKDYQLAQVAYNLASDLEEAAFAPAATTDALQKYQVQSNQMLLLLNDLQLLNNQFGGTKK